MATARVSLDICLFICPIIFACLDNLLVHMSFTNCSILFYLLPAPCLDYLLVHMSFKKKFSLF